MEIYYIGSQSELKMAQKLQENLTKHAGNKANDIPLSKFGTKGRVIPEEIILMAHSDQTRQYIGDLTPTQLAQTLASQFKGQNLSQLKSIKLVACEGGYGERPLAQQFAEALYKQGFTNVVVKAATHPKESKIGGVVSVTTQAGISVLSGNEDGMVTAVMYGNQKTADYIKWKQLKRIPNKTARNPQGGRTEEQEQQMQNLADKYNNFIGFSEKSPDYCLIKLLNNIEDLNAPQNCYTASGVQSSVSLDAVIALAFLRERKRLHDLLHHETEAQYYAQIIEQINKNPSQGRSEIFALLEINVKGTNAGWRKEVKDELSQSLKTKTIAMNLAVRPTKLESITPKIEGDQEYLARLLKKDSYFDKFWRSIYGAEAFINDLRINLKRHSTQILYAKAEREDIIGLIRCQEEKDIEAGRLTETRTSTHFGNLFSATKKVVQETSTDLPLKNLYVELKAYCDQQNPTSAGWTRVEEARSHYHKNQPTEKKSPELESLIERLARNDQKFRDLNKGLGIIKQQVDKAIEIYLKKYDKGENTDQIHKPKVAVMKAMKNYANELSEENWHTLEAAANSNPGWDKGWFSKVRFFMAEVTEARKEQIKETERVISDLNKGI